MKLTLSWLSEKAACVEALNAFKKRFGEEAEYQDVLDALAESNHVDWALWLIRTVGPVKSVKKIAGQVKISGHLFIAGSLEIERYVEVKGLLLAGSGKIGRASCRERV